ncbi:hypothetical protein ABT297_08735 [Dactylosporangium sp. NPDC000555]|uniref:hypothetical protein n=1 Tax=Dactylosporangium sp. NPDC000555 TaxID=3154260 RepID=UPI00332A3130
MPVILNAPTPLAPLPVATCVTTVDAVIRVSTREPRRRIVPQDWRYDRIDRFVTTALPAR